jgi:hypothetical protein
MDLCILPPQLQKAGKVKPEKAAFTIHVNIYVVWAMTLESRNNEAREEPWKRPLLDNGLVNKSFRSRVSAPRD